MKLLLSLLFLSATAFAHEGHDHDKPVSIKAPKGGILKSIEETNIEVLSRNKKLFVYLYDKKLNPKKTKGFKVSATAKLPRTKDVKTVSLKDNGDYYESEFSPNIHRYTLLLKIMDPATGHNDQLKFVIEPKR